MTAIVEGPVLGLLLGKLCEGIMKVKHRVANFKPHLNRLERMLISAEPNIEKIDALNRGLDRSDETKELKDLLQKGELLVRKCSELNRWNYLAIFFHQKKISKLEEGILYQINFVLKIQQSADAKETLSGVKENSDVLREIRLQSDRMEMGVARIESSLDVDGPFSSSFRRGGLVGGCSSPVLKVKPVGFEIPLRDLKTKLLKDDKVSLIVVSAPGGCGKSTLASALCHDRDVKGKFKGNMFYITVSKHPKLLGIVKKLFQHKYDDVPKFQGEEDALKQLGWLFSEMEPDPILLVLDDVWSGSESLLEKFKFEFPNYKILVTSRSEFPGFGFAYKLHPLNDKHSMTLFRSAAGLQNKILDIPEETLSQVVKKCKGFPLTLKVVGGSLRGKPEEIWKSTMIELSRTGAFLEYDELLNSLQTSLDQLDKKFKLKECFKDLCLFPEDQRIPVPALIDMWVELYKLDADVIAVANLQELSYRNLVDLVIIRKDVCGCYNQHYVMHHDLLRELATHHNNSEPMEKRKRLIMEITANDIPDWWMKQKQISRGRLLSISTDERFSSNWCNIDAPEAEVLVLNFWAKSYILPKFMDNMKELKVLIVMNYGFFPTELRNFPVLGTLSNLKRIRLEHVSVPASGFTSINLEKLQKITLVMCVNISHAFSISPSKRKISGALPNLVEINIEYSKDLVRVPEEFCNLVKVKKLSITSCPKLVALPEEIDRLVSLEILRLNSCTKLSALPNKIGGLRNLNILDISECCEIETLPEEIGNLHKLSVLDISECSGIKRLPERIDELHNLNKLNMMGCSDDMKLPSSVSRLENLKEVICDQVMESCWKHYTPYIKDLVIEVRKKEESLNCLFI